MKDMYTIAIVFAMQISLLKEYVRLTGEKKIK